jgi:hypothetical protein
MGEERGAYMVLARKPEGSSGIDGGIISKSIFEKTVGSMDWINLAQDRDRWQAVVNAVINLRVP